MKSRVLVNIIKGREVKIKQILEKWRVCEKDIDIVLDEIANIESDTVHLVKLHESEIAYREKFDGKRKSKQKQKEKKYEN